MHSYNFQSMYDNLRRRSGPIQTENLHSASDNRSLVPFGQFSKFLMSESNVPSQFAPHNSQMNRETFSSSMIPSTKPSLQYVGPSSNITGMNPLQKQNGNLVNLVIFYFITCK